MFKGLSVSWWYFIIQIFFILFQTVKYEAGNPWTVIQRALNNVGEGCLFSLRGKQSTVLCNVQVTGYSGGNVQEGVFLQMVLLTEVLLDICFLFCFFFSNSPFLPKVLGNKSLYYKNIQTRLGLIEVSPDSLFPERPARKVGRWPPASLHRLGIQ